MEPLFLMAVLPLTTETPAGRALIFNVTSPTCTSFVAPSTSTSLYNVALIVLPASSFATVPLLILTPVKF